MCDRLGMYVIGISKGYVVLDESHSSSDAENVLLFGEDVALGPMNPDHLLAFTRWFNDPLVVRGLAVPFRPLTAEAEQSWYEEVSASDQSSVHFTIYERASGRPIGNTALTNIDKNAGTAVFGIAIGNRSVHSRGYGTETTKLMLDYAFQTLGLHSVLLEVHEWNVAGWRAYLKAGFREIGRRRLALRLGGRRWDAILMASYRDEWPSVDLTQEALE